MRQFALINKDGERYNLNDVRFWLHQPKNLGFERKAKYTAMGNSFKAYQDSLKQPNPEGEMFFTGTDVYEQYYAFARFISKEPLRLDYTPAQTTYSLDCVVSKLKKSEIEDGGLHCDIEFEALGFYYQKHALISNSDLTAGKIYSYPYPYTYADTMPGMIQLDVDAVMDCPTIITIYGPCVKPSWKHYVNNIQVASGKCDITLLTGHNLVIDCVSTPFSITEQDNLGNIFFDRYEDSDFSTERFMFLKNGNNRIVVSQDGAIPPELKVETRVLYETV